MSQVKSLDQHLRSKLETICLDYTIEDRNYKVCIVDGHNYARAVGGDDDEAAVLRKIPIVLLVTSGSVLGSTRVDECKVLVDQCNGILD